MSGSVSVAEAPTTGLGKLISENVFFVPTHQRDYKWDHDRVEKLFDDLEEALDRGDQFYFIGLMVFMREGERLRVLDGQQRLATAIIIFSALKAWFAPSDPQTSAKIMYDFIGRTEYGDAAATPKITLNRNNDDRFQQHVVKGTNLIAIKAELKAANKNSPNFNLLSSIVFCHERIAQKAAKLVDEAATKDHFVRFLRFLRDSVMVVRLTVPNESNAFRVFETLNDRGMDLAAVDLVKNYLFGLAADKSSQTLEQMEHRWSQLTATLQNHSQEDFLKVFWTSRYGLIKNDDLFEAVKEECKTAEDAWELSIDLLEAGEHYAALEAADDLIWREHSKEARALIADLAKLKSKTIRPVLLAAIKKVQPKDFERLLRLLETIIIRWQVIGEERTSPFEVACARLAVGIWKGEITSGAAAFGIMKSVYPDDSVFQDQFQEKGSIPRTKAAYILRKIEEAERTAKNEGYGKELLANESLSLEHIIPQNPGSEWSEVMRTDSAFHDECCDRIGNLCLLAVPKNKGVGRKPFPDKRGVYAKSSLLTTQQVAQYESWNRKSVEQRQAWLAKRAVDCWRFQSS